MDNKDERVKVLFNGITQIHRHNEVLNLNRSKPHLDHRVGAANSIREYSLKSEQRLILAGSVIKVMDCYRRKEQFFCWAFVK